MTMTTEGTAMTMKAADNRAPARRFLGKAVSKAIESELLAVSHYRRLAEIAPSAELRARVLADGIEEARHAVGLERAASRDGLALASPTTWGSDLDAIHAAFERCARDGDVAACLFMQDVMLEAAAIGIYETLARSATAAEAFAVAVLIDKVIVPAERLHLADGLRAICTFAPERAERQRAFERAASLLVPAMRVFAEPPSDVGCARTCTSCRDRCLKLDACDAGESIGGSWEAYRETIAKAASSVGVLGARL
jgi:rubrerythrin